MSHSRFRVRGRVLTLIVPTLIAVFAAERSSAATIPRRQCEDLIKLTIPAAAIGLPTSGGTITKSSNMAEQPPERDAAKDPDGERQLTTASRCVVLGEIHPIDGKAPKINFAVNLPVEWNGKTLQSGGGGMGGAVITAPGQKASGRIDPVPLDLPYPINLGYATYGSDGGHSGPDHKFLQNDEAVRNWAGDALKKTHDVAQMIIEAAYGQKAVKKFFTGESAGGRESLWVAQRYPTDYDGVIATSPVLDWTYIHLADNAIRTRLIQGWLDNAAIKLVAENTRATCDKADGLADGLIGRYLECPNTVGALRCSNGQPGEGCLSDNQIASVNAIRSPWSMSVTLANNITRFPGFGVTGDEDGARYQWSFYTVGKEKPAFPLAAGRGFEAGRGAILNFSNLWVRHAIAQDESFEPYHFDPSNYRKRIQYLSSLIDATNPDLGRLRDNGGKLIMYQPSADNAVSTAMVAEYYRAVVRTMGKSSTDDFMRFYVGPGGGHNATGISQIDTLTLMEKWVEKGEPPPEQLVAVDLDPVTLKHLGQMPACIYPKYAKYVGSGDPKSAASFQCTDRPDPLAYQAP
jgi:hypothetical protein